MLFDAAPDAWGRTVMATSEGSDPTELPEKTVLLKGQGGEESHCFCEDLITLSEIPARCFDGVQPHDDGVRYN